GCLRRGMGTKHFWPAAVGPVALARRVLSLVWIVAAEYTGRVFRINIILRYECCRIGEREHVFTEPEVVSQDVVDQSAEKGDVGADSNRHPYVGERRGPAKSGVHVDECCSALLCFHWPSEADRMSLRHVRPHDQHAVAILKILLKCRGRAAAE